MARNHPADTLRNNDVVITPKWRQFDVITAKCRFGDITTLSLRHVFGGHMETDQTATYGAPYTANKTVCNTILKTTSELLRVCTYDRIYIYLRMTMDPFRIIQNLCLIYTGFKLYYHLVLMSSLKQLYWHTLENFFSKTPPEHSNSLSSCWTTLRSRQHPDCKSLVCFWWSQYCKQLPTE